MTKSAQQEPVPSDRREYHREWYRRNKERHSAYGKERRIWKASRRRLWINRYKVARGCDLCGYADSAVALEWHHLDPNSKEENVAKLVEGARRNLIDEMRKCVVLCANCHRRVHAGELHLEDNNDKNTIP